MRMLDYTIKDPLGMHARPAGMLAKEMSRFACDIQLQKGEKSADAKRIFQMMGLAVKCGDTVRVLFTGTDEDEAAQVIGAYLIDNDY